MAPPLSISDKHDVTAAASVARAGLFLLTPIRAGWPIKRAGLWADDAIITRQTV
jgi:hypothetical protein